MMLYGLFLILLILTISNKENFHVDEMYSYGLANHQGGISISFEDGKTYMPSTEPYTEYLTVGENARFDYKNVWENQAEDVHPPLYYVLLHTICSLFPGRFSKWYAGSINIVFALLTLFALRKLIRNLTGDNKKVCGIVSVLFVLSSGIFSAVSFLRMYILAMFWVTLLTEMIVKEAENEKFRWNFFAKLYVTAVLGALTHYYCIVFTVFLCAAFGLFLLLKKRWASAAGLLGTGILSGGTAYFLFPAMITHMFYGYRGTEAIDNLKQSPYEFWIRIKIFFKNLDKEIFGNTLGYLLLGFVLLAVVSCIFENRMNFRKVREWLLGALSPDTDEAKMMAAKYVLVFVPVILYFFMVTKMAAFTSARYMFPVYAVAVGGFFSLVIICLRNVLKNKSVYFIMAALLSIVIINEWKNVEWTYLYRSSAEFLEQLENYGDVDCLYVYDSAWETQPSFVEIQKYRSVTFVPSGNLEMLSTLEIADQDQLMVMVTADKKKTLETIMETYPQLEKNEEIGSFGSSTTYYLYAE